ncbi:hypothetical protein V3C99_015056 [Haemonchus contortus]
MHGSADEPKNISFSTPVTFNDSSRNSGGQVVGFSMLRNPLVRSATSPSRRLFFHGASDSAVIDDEDEMPSMMNRPESFSSLSSLRLTAGMENPLAKNQIPTIQQFDEDGRIREDTSGISEDDEGEFFHRYIFE